MLARVAGQEWAWAQNWTGELVRFLTADPVHAEHNRATLDAWTETWRPRAIEAAAALPVEVDIERILAERRDAPPALRRPTRRRTRPNARRVEPEPQGDGHVGIVMAKSADGDAVAAVLGQREGIQVIEQPSFWDIRAKVRLAIPFAEISERLGYEVDAYSIQHEMSTHYGRLVAGDDALMLFADPAEAMEHLLS